MATYRCPECGASHKEAVPNCRLCGAPLDIAVTVRNVTVDRSISADRFRRKGMGHFIIAGAVLLALIALGVFLTGGVDDDGARGWFYRLPFIDPPVEDVWFDWADPNEVMIVELPATVEEGSAGTIDLGASNSNWVTAVGRFDAIIVGYTEDLGFAVPVTSEGDDRTRSSTEGALRDALESAAASQGGFVQNVGELFIVGDGHLALDGVIDGISTGEGPGFGSIRLVMVDSEIVFVETVAFSRNTDNHQRVRESLVIVADDPDQPIPTVPEDAPAPGGIVEIED